MTQTATGTAAPQRREVDVDGVKTSMVEMGSGDPLLLVHGSGPGIASYFSFQAVAGELAERYRVLMVDMPGYGFSAALPDADTPANVAKHLVRLFDVLGIDSAFVVGHSRGGRIACELAVLAPERVRRLVVVGAGSVAPGGHLVDGGWTAPALALVNWGTDGDLSFESFRTAYMTQVVREENLPDEWLRQAYEDAVSVGGLEHFVKTMAQNDPLRYYHQKNADEFGDKLAALDTPTLVLWGREDRCSPYQKAVALLDVMKDIQLTVLPDCDHFVPIDQPAAFNRVVIEFLSREG